MELVWDRYYLYITSMIITSLDRNSNLFLFAADTSLISSYSNFENLKLTYFLDIYCLRQWLERFVLKLVPQTLQLIKCKNARQNEEHSNHGDKQKNNQTGQNHKIFKAIKLTKIFYLTIIIF